MQHTLSDDEQMIQRHVGPRLSNLSDDGQVAGLRPTSGGLHSSGRGTEPLVSPPPLTDALRRGYESVDCDTPDRLNADLSTSSRPLVAAADCSCPLMDAMLVDQDSSNPFFSPCRLETVQ